jgi:preprotein translocase subunit Sss1
VPIGLRNTHSEHQATTIEAYMLISTAADRREFIKISQAVGVGFLVMGAVGYLVKLSKFSWISQ